MQATSTDLVWTDNAGVSLWDVEWGTTGFVQGAGTMVTGTSTNPHNLTSLTASTSYEFYVRADCGGSTSTWTGPYSFTTTIACPAPLGLTANNITATSANLAWTDSAGVSLWDIEWDIAGFTQGAGTMIPGTSTNPHNLTGLTASTSYEFYVRADCSGSGTSIWVGPFSFTTPCVAPIISSFPFTENFDGETIPELPCGWTISDDNNDNRQWLTSTAAPLSGANSLYINWTLGGTGPLNDWIFTPELQLTGGTSYDLQFAYKSRGSTFVESMSVWLGSAKDSASMTTMLFDSTNFAFAAYDTVMVTFTPSTTSSYYIGFFGYSQNDQFGILVDDFSLDVSTITSVSDVKNNVALTVYPNPNKGVFTLNVNTTDVKELEIKVMNLQGQVVFVKNSFDNISTINENVDLSNNAKGIYFVMVTSDKGVITHKVVVQ